MMIHIESAVAQHCRHIVELDRELLQRQEVIDRDTAIARQLTAKLIVAERLRERLRSKSSEEPTA